MGEVISEGLLGYRSLCNNEMFEAFPILSLKYVKNIHPRLAAHNSIFANIKVKASLIFYIKTQNIILQA